MIKINHRVAVIGDCMLDRYCQGYVSRISPEAPVPVVSITKEYCVPGGAANVANNIKSLGCEVHLFGLVGEDQNGIDLIEQLKENGISCQHVKQIPQIHTTTKQRVMGNHQQITRLDFNDEWKADSEILDRYFEESIKPELERYDVVVLSDYNKGLLTGDFCSQIIESCRHKNIPVIVDPKGCDWVKYSHATILTPNLKELSEYLKVRLPNEEKQIFENSASLITQLRIEHLLVTRSEAGMSLISEKEICTFHSEAKEVFDVSGAGDTVVAVLAVLYNRSRDLKETVAIANKAGGLVVGKRGTATLSIEELEDALKEKRYLSEKIMSIGQVKEFAENCRQKGKTVVFTNGCFDIIHRGHIDSLYQSATYGDCLIVGLNSDSSVKKLKGDHRPVNCAINRAYVLAGIGCVDAVVIFEDETPEKLLSLIRPDILTKGGDYLPAEVAGGQYAGKVVITDFVEGYSTTKIIKSGHD